MPDKSLSFYLKNKQIEECYFNIGNKIGYTMKVLLFQTVIIFFGLSSSVYCQNSIFMDIEHYKQEIKNCYNTESPLNSSKEIIKYGISVEKCLPNCGSSTNYVYFPVQLIS